MAKHNSTLRLKSRINHDLTITAVNVRAAIYSRKSTDDNDRNADNKSVTRQVEHGRAFASSKGWTVDDQHVFIDDGISGAEYQNRPGFTKLLTQIKDFQVLVMSEPSRFGRDMLRNAYHVGEIIDSGVRIFYYLNDEEEKAETPEQKIMLTLKSYASEVERQKASHRSRDALERKAKHGYNTGGVVYGYDNNIINSKNGAGELTKSHTDYSINKEQADTIRRIFRMYASGFGHTAIAKTMNGDTRYKTQSHKYFDDRTPPTPRKGTASWAPSSIREMLYNARYTGKVPFGEYRKVYKGGTKKRVKVGAPTYAARPDLRILPEDLWSAVQSRLKSVRASYVRENGGTLWGRPEAGRESKYLLSGLARCGCCGASMIATKIALGSRKGRHLVSHYQCSYNSNRGNSVCSNNWRERQETLDGKVLTAIERSILTPDAVNYVVDKAIKLVEERRRKEPDPTEKLEAQIRRLTRERDNLIALAASGRSPASVLNEIHKREQAIETLKGELARIPHRLRYDARELGSLKAAMRERMTKFQELMHSDVSLARQALRKLLSGPIKCIPVMRYGKKSYAFKGETRLGALLSTPSVTLASPRGFEPRLPP